MVGSPTMGSDGTELHAPSHTNAAEMAGPVQRRSTLADFFLIAGFRFLLGGAQWRRPQGRDKALLIGVRTLLPARHAVVLAHYVRRADIAGHAEHSTALVELNTTGMSER